MIIPCPFCNTKFKINDNVIGQKKLIKFQCSKCKTVFRFDRVSRSSWKLEEEKTLPMAARVDEKKIKEFFEKKKIEETDKDIEAATDVFRKKEEKTADFEDSYESFEPEKPAPVPGEAPPPTPPGPIKPVKPDPPDIDATPRQPLPSPQPKEIAAARHEPSVQVFQEDSFQVSPPPTKKAPEKTPRVPKSTMPPDRPRPSSPEKKILTSDLYVLELEYELSEKPLKQTTTRAKVFGLSAFIILLILSAFYLFLSWKNDWDFAAIFTNPSDAFAIAMGHKSKLKIAPDAEGIETVVTRIYSTETANGIRVLVVQGEVLNTTVFPKKQIRIYIEAINSQDQVIESVKTMSGITLLTQKQVEEKSLSGLTMYFESERKKADEWIVNSNRKVAFQAFIRNPPSGAEDPNRYYIRATAVSAVNALGR